MIIYRLNLYIFIYRRMYIYRFCFKTSREESGKPIFFNSIPTKVVASVSLTSLFLRLRWIPGIVNGCSAKKCLTGCGLKCFTEKNSTGNLEPLKRGLGPKYIPTWYKGVLMGLIMKGPPSQGFFSTIFHMNVVSAKKWTHPKPPNPHLAGATFSASKSGFSGQATLSGDPVVVHLRWWCVVWVLYFCFGSLRLPTQTTNLLQMWIPYLGEW